MLRIYGSFKTELPPFSCCRNGQALIKKLLCLSAEGNTKSEFVDFAEDTRDQGFTMAPMLRHA